jgi:choice-of-anchor A domain-containing protein
MRCRFRGGDVPFRTRILTDISLVANRFLTKGSPFVILRGGIFMTLRMFLDRRVVQSTVLGFLGVLSGFSRTEAGTVQLGAAANYNVYVSGSMTQDGGDVATSVAVGGSASMTSFGIYGAGVPATSDSLVVGGNLSFTNSSIGGGNTRVAGDVTASSATIGGTLYYGGANNATNGTYDPKFAQGGGIPPTFFSGANGQLQSVSSTLASQGANGATSLSGTTLTLTGSNSAIDYFSVTSAQLATSTSLNIVAPSGATVVVNVDGATDTLTGGMSLSGVAEDKVLFNFYNATTLYLGSNNSGLAFLGSVLAPDATLYGTNGHTDGNVMVGGISATAYSFEYHDTGLFNGTLTVANTPSLSSVPEPPTIVLAGLGTVGAVILAARKRKLKTPQSPR